MYPPQSKTWQDQEHLGALAMKFRSTRDETKRRAIAEDYSQTVAHLIAGGSWDWSPAPEDQLPDDWMPPSFLEYWLRTDPA